MLAEIECAEAAAFQEIARMQPAPERSGVRTQELHVILLWSRARAHVDRIMADIRGRFVVRDVVSVSWTPERFGENLSRFYGMALPPDSDKQRRCGTGPFLLVVVEDPAAVYERRWTNRGFASVNRDVFRAKLRYRLWTGSADGVHTSDTAQEAVYDLFFLLGRRPAAYATRRAAWDGTIAQHGRDLLGSDGWDTVDQFLEAIRFVTPAVLQTQSDIGEVELLVDDVWWAELIANGQRVEGERPASAVKIGGRDVIVRFHASGRPLPQPSPIVPLVRPFVGALRAVSHWFPDRP